MNKGIFKNNTELIIRLSKNELNRFFDCLRCFDVYNCSWDYSNEHYDLEQLKKQKIICGFDFMRDYIFLEEHIIVYIYRQDDVIYVKGYDNINVYNPYLLSYAKDRVLVDFKVLMRKYKLESLDLI